MAVVVIQSITTTMVIIITIATTTTIVTILIIAIIAIIATIIRTIQITTETIIIDIITILSTDSKMGLSIAVFVPEGIIIGCDNQAEVNNTDDGYIQPKQTKLFTFADKYLLNIIGTGFIKGLPYAYHVEKIFHMISNVTFKSTREFAVSFDEKFSTLFDKNEQVSYYIAGIDYSKDFIFEPTIFFVENQHLYPVNRSVDGNIVYNYHAVGNSVWLDKLFLPTFAHVSENEDVSLEETRIDFNKYSIENAIDFVNTMLEISNKMDCIAQIRPRVGTSYNLGILPLNSIIKII